MDSLFSDMLDTMQDFFIGADIVMQEAFGFMLIAKWVLAVMVVLLLLCFSMLFVLVKQQRKQQKNVEDIIGILAGFKCTKEGELENESISNECGKCD